jgi:hypothetical protein
MSAQNALKRLKSFVDIRYYLTPDEYDAIFDACRDKPKPVYKKPEIKKKS